MHDATVSFLIPSFNGYSSLERELPSFIHFLNQSSVSFEIIIINDGGRDHELLKKLANTPRVLLLTYEQNQGKGFAIRTGMQQAGGDVIIYTDADIPFQYANVLTIIESIKAGDADLVMGDRTLDKSEYYIHTTFIRRLGSKIISWFATKMIDRDIEDSQCGLKGFTRNAAHQTIVPSRTSRFAIDFEILHLASKHQLKIRKIPVQLRNQAKSTVHPFTDGIQILWDILFTIRK